MLLHSLLSIIVLVLNLSILASCLNISSYATEVRLGKTYTITYTPADDTVSQPSFLPAFYLLIQLFSLQL